MILDSLQNWRLYRSLGPRFEIAFKALNDGIGQREDGTYEIDGKNVRALVQRYDTKSREQCRWEAHRRHIDVQLIQSGAERMGWWPAEKLTVSDPYNPEKDVMFFTGDGGEYFTVSAGSFAVFFPTDAHGPCIQIESPAPITKVVMKILVE